MKTIDELDLNKAMQRMRETVDAQPTKDHPFSHALRALARSHGVRHVVWAFANPLSEDLERRLVVAGTTTARAETVALLSIACVVAEQHHGAMRSEELVYVPEPEEAGR